MKRHTSNKKFQPQSAFERALFVNGVSHISKKKHEHDWREVSTSGDLLDLSTGKVKKFPTRTFYYCAVKDCSKTKRAKRD